MQTKLLSIDEIIIKDVLPVLEMFNKLTLILSQNNSPTIHLVKQIKRKLITRLEEKSTDSKTMREFKNILKTNVEFYLKIHFIYNFLIQNEKT